MSINIVQNNNNAIIIQENIDMIVSLIKLIVVVQEKNLNISFLY